MLFLLGILYVGETHHKRIAKTNYQLPILRIYKQKLSCLKFLGFFLTLGLNFGCLISFISLAPFIYTHFYGLSLRKFGAYFLLASLLYIAMTVIYSRVADRIQPEKWVKLADL